MGVFSDWEEELKLESLPVVTGNQGAKFSELQKEVQQVAASASWWEKWGEDCAIMLSAVFIVLPAGLILLGSSSVPWFALGMVCMGFCHHMGQVKGAHLFGHRSLGFSETWNKFFMWFSIEFIGAFPWNVAYDGHIKIHHPHTNIIGLGDSSTWRIPQLPCILYMLIMPLFLPFMTLVAGIGSLIKEKQFSRLLTYLPSAFAGYFIQYMLYRYVSMLSPWSALICCFATRAVFQIPYIHVNIFQHIGLCMFTRKNRPDRLTQMSSGVLNLPRHLVLDWNFGHSIINCHIEHHLFPTLSDAICLKIKPTVQQYFKKHGLMYKEKTYANRLLLFLWKYNELMVHAPPITEFVAVQ